MSTNTPNNENQQNIVNIPAINDESGETKRYNVTTCKTPQKQSDESNSSDAYIDITTISSQYHQSVNNSIISNNSKSLLLSSSSSSSFIDIITISSDSADTNGSVADEMNMNLSRKREKTPKKSSVHNNSSSSSSNNNNHSNSNNQSLQSNGSLFTTSSDEDSALGATAAKVCKRIGDLRLSTTPQRPSPPSPQSPSTATATVVTTRSGRAVRARVDHKFDYSSELNDIDESDIEKESDFLATDDDDDDDDDSTKSSSSSFNHNNDVDADDSESSAFESSAKSSPLRFKKIVSINVYIDLSIPTAVVKNEPQHGDIVDQDAELKTQLNEFLGISPTMRKLFNPLDESYDDGGGVGDMEIPELQPRRFICNTTTTTTRTTATTSSTTNTIAADNLHQSTSTSLLSQPLANISFGDIKSSPLTSTPRSVRGNQKTRGQLTATHQELEKKLMDERLLLVNADHFERQTPFPIKLPIDLNQLPHADQRARNCRNNCKSIGAILKSNPHSYSFISSLSDDVPTSLCHSVALRYRKLNFDNCKYTLAKVIFNLLNHSIFHCGLELCLKWSRGHMKVLGKCEHLVHPNGQRYCRIILGERINKPMVLFKVLIHEMCHAAAFVFHGEMGHGDNCRKWCYQAKRRFIEIQTINDCLPTFQYLCCLCHKRSNGLSELPKEIQLRCHFCQFEVVTKEQTEHGLYPLPLIQKPSQFKQFVKEQYNNNNNNNNNNSSVLCNNLSYSAKMMAINEKYLQQIKKKAAN